MSKKKVTQEELSKIISEFGNEVAQVFQIMGADIVRLQTMVYNHLEEEGKMERIVCAECQGELLRPNIKGVEKSDDCPSCGKDVFGNKQSTFENWDAGLTNEEE